MGNDKTEKKFTLVFIINGEDVTVSVNANNPLHVARDRALKDSGNEGRPFPEWEIRREDGSPLSPDAKIEDVGGLADGTRLLLSLKAGAGGC